MQVNQIIFEGERSKNWYNKKNRNNAKYDFEFHFNNIKLNEDRTERCHVSCDCGYEIFNCVGYYQISYNNKRQFKDDENKNIFSNDEAFNILKNYVIEKKKFQIEHLKREIEELENLDLNNKSQLIKSDVTLKF